MTLFEFFIFTNFFHLGLVEKLILRKILKFSTDIFFRKIFKILLLLQSRFVIKKWPEKNALAFKIN
jgi:hypothetical protein